MSAARPVVTPGRRRLVRVRRWFADHDDRWSFTALYITLAVVLSMTISLFWLVAVVAAHGAIEYWSLGRQGITENRLGWVFWHLKLDLALVVFALWLGVYIEVMFGLAGLSAAARTGAQAAARFVAWQRVVRGVLLTVDDAAVVAKSVAGRNHRADAGTGRSSPEPNAPWRRSWSGGDWVSLFLLAAFSAMLLAAPWLTHHDYGSMLLVLAQDLHPWP